MSSETVNQQQIRLALARAGVQAWRNNSGACQDTKTGRLIRYGLANDSAQLNEHIKSSDLIACVPRLILPSDVGRVLGVFAAVECKASDYAKDDRYTAQAKFHDIVRSVGGLAGFATTPEEALYICTR